MHSVIAVLSMLAIAGMLGVSIWKFWRDGRIEAKSTRRLAAASSAFSLLIAVLIYFGLFERNLLEALKYLNVSETAYDNWANALSSIDQVVSDITDVLNVFSSNVVDQFNSPLWPAALLVLGYAARFTIYRFHTKKGNKRAALTGSVYWSHLTAYAMGVAFFVVIVGWSAAVVLPLSLVVLLAFVAIIRLAIEDGALVLRVAVGYARSAVIRAARLIAFVATWIAEAVRTFMSYANDLYLAHVRKPLRARLRTFEQRNSERLKKSADRLAEQDRRQGEKFDGFSDE